MRRTPLTRRLHRLHRVRVMAAGADLPGLWGLSSRARSGHSERHQFETNLILIVKSSTALNVDLPAREQEHTLSSGWKNPLIPDQQSKQEDT